jgi:hypothetical protein
MVNGVQNHSIKYTAMGTSPLPQNSYATYATASRSACRCLERRTRSDTITAITAERNDCKDRQRLLSSSGATARCILTMDGFRSMTSGKCLPVTRKLSLRNTSNPLTTEIGITNGSSGTGFGI